MTTIGKAILALVLGSGVMGQCAAQVPAATQGSQERLSRWKGRNCEWLILVGDADIPDVHAHAGAIEAEGRSAWSLAMQGI
jgi:hypothetical protein